MKKLLFVALVAASCFAATTYTQSFTSANFVKILGTTHQLSCSAFTVTIRDSTGNKLPTAVYWYVIDPSYYDATISFNTTETGTVALQGCFSPTTASTDFQPVATAAGTITVCGSCTSTSYANREFVSAYSYIKWFVGTQSWTVNALSNGVSGTAYLYLDSVSLRFTVAMTSSSAGVNIPGGSLADYIFGASGYPNTAVPIATVTYDGAGNFGTLTDTRAFQN